MKLIGSAVEKQYRSELEAGARYLLEEGGDPRLLALLRQKVGAVESAYYLSGYSLSDYQTYNLLVNGNVICQIEISDGKIEACDVLNISKYKKGLKKQSQIKLQVALELASRGRTVTGD